LVHDVSTVIPGTGVTAVIGPSGAGKSALLRTCKKATLETVRRLYDAFAANDLETILATTDPDIDVVQTPLLPWGGEFHGHAGLGGQRRCGGAGRSGL
jgi:ABC-type nitrate/sulfonate/bicarbonate transport system ATPase subunit